MVQSHPAYASLARLMPKFLDYDAARNTLVLELLRESENLAEYHGRLGEFPTEIGRLIGSRIGDLPFGDRPRIRRSDDVDFLPGSRLDLIDPPSSGDRRSFFSGGNANW